MKKCYLLLGLMALTPLLLICNSVLAGEQNSESERWKDLGKAAGSGAAAASAAAAEIVDQRFKYYKEIGIIQDEVREVRSEVTDPKDQVGANKDA